MSDPTDHELRIFRAFQATGSYAATAQELGLTLPQVRRGLGSLYAKLGVSRGAHRGLSSIRAAKVLDER